MSATAPTPTNQTRRLCDYLQGADGRGHFDELLLFADRRIRRGSWCVKRDGTMPGGDMADDVVNRTIQAVLALPETKGHRCVPDHVDMGVALRRIIKSKINHVLESAENATRTDFPEPPLGGDDFESAQPFWAPAEENMSDDDKAEAILRCDQFIQYAKKQDRNVHDILVLIRNEGIDRPVEAIAKRLGIKIADVFNARKRLGTLVRKYKRLEIKK